MWTTINENLGRCCTTAGTSGVDDRERRRTLQPAGGGIGGIDLRPGHEGEQLSVDAGILGLDVIAATFDPTRGQLVAAGTTGLASMAVRDGDYTWQDAGGAPAWPTSTPTGLVLAYDAAADRVLRFGGSGSSSPAMTDELWTLDRADATPSWTRATASGPTPSARGWAGSIVDPASRTMYVVGGYDLEGGTTLVDRSDVAALDLATMTWRTVASLPVARSSPLLRLADGGASLYVVFGDAHETPSDPYTVTRLHDAYRIDTASGTVTTLTVSGDFPTNPARVLGGLELPGGYVVLSPETYGVEAYRVTFSGSGVVFTRDLTCEESRSFGWGPGVVDPATDVGYVVGSSVWEVRE
jgi:hypothetical protein